MSAGEPPINEQEAEARPTGPRREDRPKDNRSLSSDLSREALFEAALARSLQKNEELLRRLA